jgi:hypothetical protein
MLNLKSPGIEMPGLDKSSGQKEGTVTAYSDLSVRP